MGISLALATAALMPRAALAEQEHKVKPGQTLGSIAKRYGVSVYQLATRNGIKRDAALRQGQVLMVPPQGIVYVAPGQTLASIAHARAVDAGELASRNGLKPGAALKAGQRLVLPGYDDSGDADDARKRWGAPKSRGVVTLYRIWSKQTRRLRLLDGRGRPRPEAIRQMSVLLRPRLAAKRRKDPHPRLLRLLSQVSDHFGGRPIHVVSGFRLPGGYTQETSRHVAGEAIDFRIPGVSLTELRDYCQHFDHSGCGYYPRSHFVHMDVRRKSARWTDWSLPGQAPMLRDPSSPDPAKLDGADESPPEVKDEAQLQEPPPAEDDGLPALDE